MIPLISDLFISTNLSFSLEGSEGSLGHHQLVLFRSPTEVSDGRLCLQLIPLLSPLPRYLQTLSQIAAERNSTIVFPLPIELMGQLMPKQGQATSM